MTPELSTALGWFVYSAAFLVVCLGILVIGETCREWYDTYKSWQSGEENTNDD